MSEPIDIGAMVTDESWHYVQSRPVEGGQRVLIDGFVMPVPTTIEHEAAAILGEQGQPQHQMCSECGAIGWHVAGCSAGAIRVVSADPYQSMPVAGHDDPDYLFTDRLLTIGSGPDPIMREQHVFYVQVEVTRRRVVKVSAQSLEQAEAAAEEIMVNDLANYPPGHDDGLATLHVTADDFTDDDSVTCEPTDDPADYRGFWFSEDDPGHRAGINPSTTPARIAAVSGRSKRGPGEIITVDPGSYPPPLDPPQCPTCQSPFPDDPGDECRLPQTEKWGPFVDGWHLAQLKVMDLWPMD